MAILNIFVAFQLVIIIATLYIINIRRAIEQEKKVYKESFETLRVLKPEIEHIRKV